MNRMRQQLRQGVLLAFVAWVVLLVAPVVSTGVHLPAQLVGLGFICGGQGLPGGAALPGAAEHASCGFCLLASAGAAPAAEPVRALAPPAARLLRTPLPPQAQLPTPARWQGRPRGPPTQA